MNLVSKRWVLLSTFTVIVLTLIVVFGRNYSGQAYAKTSWEYKIVYSEAIGESSLNQLGMDGWELVLFIRTDPREVRELGGKWLFKRIK